MQNTASIYINGNEKIIMIEFSDIQQCLKFYGIDEKIKNGIFTNPRNNIFSELIVEYGKDAEIEPDRIYKNGEYWVIERNALDSKERIYYVLAGFLAETDDKISMLDAPQDIINHTPDYVNACGIVASRACMLLSYMHRCPEFEKKCIADLTRFKQCGIIEMDIYYAARFDRENKYYSVKDLWKHTYYKKIYCLGDHSLHFTANFIILRDKTVIPIWVHDEGEKIYYTL